MIYYTIRVQGSGLIEVDNLSADNIMSPVGRYVHSKWVYQVYVRQFCIWGSCQRFTAGLAKLFEKAHN